MSAVAGRKTFGLFNNGCFKNNNNSDFSSYTLYTSDSLSYGACGAVDYNTYGGGYYPPERVPIDTNKYYQYAVSVKTIQTSYLGRNGSGHLGIRMYDANQGLIRVNNGGRSTDTTTLTRAASPGDTTIYLDEPWSGTNLWTYIVFFPAGHPDHDSSRPWYFRGFPVTYDDTSYTDIGGGEYTITLDAGLPNWGYSLPAGTAVTQRIGFANNNTYTLGAPIYPTEWTTYISGVLHGEYYNNGNFHNGTKYISFLNLRNHNYRSENSGDSARYLIDNILWVECPGGEPWPNELFSRNPRV